MSANRRRADFGRDYYAVLGVPETATHDEIIRAYRRLARTSHPDADLGNPQAADEFERLVAAREVLGDPATREAYDQLRASRARTTPRVRRADAPPPASPVGTRAPGGHPEPAIRPGPVVWTPETPR
ncbi:MAG TPA: J domain-containing protein [Jiangellaceae bacterium]|nr:J domain-containing protein [Jiangellaceae bacterium]